MNETKVKHALEILKQAVARHGEKLVYPCSFGAEGSVLIDLIQRAGLAIPIVTIDTGRLPQETFEVIEAIEKRYGIRVRIVFPDCHEVEEMVAAHGPNLFRRSVELRRLCCEIRKVRPLARVLADYEAWITGRRREQSAERANLPFVEEDDPVYGKIKYNPLADWTWKEVWDYIRAREVPYHPLHDRFYHSIGCACCTRPIAVGEDPRAGRWWWEHEDVAEECGLHVPASRIAPPKPGEGEQGEGI